MTAHSEPSRRTRIVVLDGYTLNPGDLSWARIERLGKLEVYDRSSPDETAARAGNADVLLTNKVPIGRGLMERLPDLSFIGVLATGYDVVDVAAAADRGIPVSNVPAYATNSVAQFAIALILELCHRVGQHAEAVGAGDWHNQRDFSMWKTLQIELYGKSLGIVGYGRIGRRLGELAHALGMNILAYSPNRRGTPGYDGFDWREPDDLFAETDIVSLNCPLTEATRGFVNKRRLAMMKSHALLINTSRGALVDEPDLAEALNAGVLAGAALDVVSAEPIAPDNPLLNAENCIITPHIAWASREARLRLMETVGENIAAFLSGTPINVVNGVTAAKEAEIK